MIRDLAVAFCDLIQFRSGPQDLPHAPRLLVALVVALLLMNFVLSQLPTAEPAPSLLRGAMAVSFVLAVIYTSLALKQLSNRYHQTALGWLGAELIFLLLGLPFLLAIGKMPIKPEEATPQQLVLIWPLFAVVLWKVAVQAHVLRHALDTRLLVGVLATISLQVVTALLFGAAG